MSLQALASGLAKKGRFGDTQLVHMSSGEVAGLARLAGGRLAINPETGLPEAFFLAPLLMGLLGGAAPAAAAAAPAVVAGATSALGAGITAGMTAAQTGLAAAAAPVAAEIAAPALAGLGTGASALTAAAPATGAGISSLIPAAQLAPSVAGQAASYLHPAAAASTGLADAAAAAPGVATQLMIPGTGAVEGTALAGMTSPNATGVAPGLASVSDSTVPIADAAANSPIAVDAVAPYPDSIGATGAVTTPPVEEPGMFGKVGSWLKENPMMALGGLGALSQLMPMMGGGGGDDEEDEDDGEGADATYESEGGTEPEFQEGDIGGYGRGSDAIEFDFFPGMYRGGIVKLAAGGGIGQGGNQNAGGGTWQRDSNFFANQRMNSLYSRLSALEKLGIKPPAAEPAPVATPFNYVPQQRRVTPQVPAQVPNNPVQGWSRSRIAPPPAQVPPPVQQPMKAGGLVKKYAAGGVASLAPQMQAPGMPMQAPVDPMAGPAMQAPGMQAEPTPQPVPTSPYPKTQVGSKSENDKELIAQTVAAIKGVHPDPNTVLTAFVQTFGEQALQDLVARVKGGGKPASDGMSDSVPAMIDGQQPAALSEGEFVVPADVVSGLGNGSTDAGANSLMEMVGRTRQMRGGGPVQPAAINPRQAMPI